MPNAETIWNDISKLAERKYKVRLTSHYFRTRFQQIAEKIPINIIPINEWMLYLGSVSTDRNTMTGHLPLIYRADDYPEMIQRFQKYLADDLALDNSIVQHKILSDVNTNSQFDSSTITQTQYTEITKKLDYLIAKIDSKTDSSKQPTQSNYPTSKTTL